MQDGLRIVVAQRLVSGTTAHDVCKVHASLGTRPDQHTRHWDAQGVHDTVNLCMSGTMAYEWHKGS